MMTLDFLSSVAGVLLSLLFAYVPGARQWYGALDSDRKRVVMLAALAATALLFWGLACTNLATDFGVPVSCDRAGAVGLVRAFLAALVANQSTYLVTPGKAEG